MSIWWLILAGLIAWCLIGLVVGLAIGRMIHAMRGFTPPWE